MVLAAVSGAPIVGTNPTQAEPPPQLKGGGGAPGRRLKLLAVWDPKRYGNKVQLGGDGGVPIKVEAQVEADTYLAALLKNTELNKQVNANE
jgi:hypothetical protein